MKVSSHLYGGADIVRRFLIGSTFSNVGVIAMATAASPTGVIPCTTTTADDVVGLTVDTGLADEGYTGTYSATPAAGSLGAVMVSVRPDAVYQALMSGGATEGTTLTVMTETAGDTATPDLITSADAQANSMIGGTVWRRQSPGNQASWHDIRPINAHTVSTSVGVPIDFEYAINVGDQFLMCPWSMLPGDGTDTTDGHSNLQTTTVFTQADASIASGTGIGNVAIVQLICRSETDSLVEFVSTDNVLAYATT